MSDREKIDLAVGEVLVEVSNYPSGARSALWGQDIGLLQDKVTEAVLAVILQIKEDAWDEGAEAVSPYSGGYLRSILVGNPYRKGE